MVGVEQQGRNGGWFSSRRIAGSHHLGNAGQVLKWGPFTGKQAAKWTTRPTGTITLPHSPNYETIRKAASIRQDVGHRGQFKTAAIANPAVAAGVGVPDEIRHDNTADLSTGNSASI
jgi:hypothetical protein